MTLFIQLRACGRCRFSQLVDFNVVSHQTGSDQLEKRLILLYISSKNYSSACLRMQLLP